MKTIDDLLKIVTEYLPTELSTLKDNLTQYNIQSVATEVLISLDDALWYDKITVEQHNKASQMFGWIGEY